MMTEPIATTLVATISVIGAVIAVLSLLVAICSIILTAQGTRRANRIVATDPWASMIMDIIMEEMVAAENERRLLVQICTQPFQDQLDKSQQMERLAQMRDSSTQRLHRMSVLTDVTVLEAERIQLESHGDSYFTNSELELATEHGQQLATEYDARFAEYTHLLKTAVINTNSR